MCCMCIKILHHQARCQHAENDATEACSSQYNRMYYDMHACEHVCRLISLAYSNIIGYIYREGSNSTARPSGSCLTLIERNSRTLSSSSQSNGTGARTSPVDTSGLRYAAPRPQHHQSLAPPNGRQTLPSSGEKGNSSKQYLHVVNCRDGGKEEKRCAAPPTPGPSSSQSPRVMSMSHTRARASGQHGNSSTVTTTQNTYTICRICGRQEVKSK